MLEIGVHYSTVGRLCSQQCSIIPKAQEDRPSRLNPTTICHVICIISTGRADTGVKGEESLQEPFPEQVSSQTIQRALNKTGFRAVVKARRPGLSKCHHRERLDFAKSHQHWALEGWKRLIWSDETKINHFGPDGRKWVWKKSGEGLSDRLVEGTVKFGGGHMGCFGWDGAGYA